MLNNIKSPPLTPQKSILFQLNFPIQLSALDRITGEPPRKAKARGLGGKGGGSVATNLTDVCKHVVICSMGTVEGAQSSYLPPRKQQALTNGSS